MDIIPKPLLASIAAELSECLTHSDINNLFEKAGFPGDIPQGNKLDKCSTWLRRLNGPEAERPFELLGGLLHDFMENEPVDPYNRPPDPALWTRMGMQPPVRPPSPWQQRKARFEAMLTKYGFRYLAGGRVVPADFMPASARTLDVMLRERDLGAIDIEFARAMDNVSSDPPAALTAACAIIEACCKVYIQERGLVLPSDQTVKPLWATVQKDLNLDPKSIADDDVKRILGGLSSIVDGIGAFRTHAGSAHGRGQNAFKVEPRHAKLAISAAHTLVIFVLETWDDAGN